MDSPSSSLMKALRVTWPIIMCGLRRWISPMFAGAALRVPLVNRLRFPTPGGPRAEADGVERLRCLCKLVIIPRAQSRGTVIGLTISDFQKKEITVGNADRTARTASRRRE